MWECTDVGEDTNILQETNICCMSLNNKQEIKNIEFK